MMTLYQTGALLVHPRRKPLQVTISLVDFTLKLMDFKLKPMDFIRKLMDFIPKLMNFILNMLKFHAKLMNIMLKMMEFAAPHCSRSSSSSTGERISPRCERCDGQFHPLIHPFSHDLYTLAPLSQQVCSSRRYNPRHAGLVLPRLHESAILRPIYAHFRPILPHLYHNCTTIPPVSLNFP